MTTANVYLNFKGNCFEAFNFYKSIIGGEFSYISRFKDIPTQEGTPPISEEISDMILHVALPVSKETMIMGSDNVGDWSPKFSQGNNFSIALNTDSKLEADRLFNGLSEGGNIIMPIADAFWGDYYGMFTDKFGVNWMVMSPSGS